MIAEIPASECATGGHEDDYRRARSVVLPLHPNAVIELVGVAFFDFLHDQGGGAKNGMELHPVLSVRVVEGGYAGTDPAERKRQIVAAEGAEE